MPKRPTRPSHDSREDNKKKQKSQQSGSFWKTTVGIVRSKRFRIATGFVLGLVVLYAFLTYISYFFHGAADFTQLHSELTGAELRKSVHNFGGILGARMQDFFVDRTFGIPVLAALVFCACLSARMMGAKRVTLWKVFLHCFFWMLWGSLALAFVQQFVGGSSFFHWGGTHGEFFCTLLIDNIQWFGTLLVLVAVLAFYGIGVSPRTLPALERMFERISALFSRKPKEEAVVDLAADAEGDSGVVIDLSEDLGLDGGKAQPAEGEMAFTIEGLQQEADTLEVVEEQTAAQPDDLGFTITETPQEEPIEIEETEEEPAAERTAADDLKIEDIKDVELVEKGKSPEELLAQLGPFDPRKDLENYKFPELNLLKVYDNESAPVIDQEEQRANANRIVMTLRNYGVEIETIKATVGPTVTLYEVVPKAGVRISKIQNLEQDIMLALSAVGIRIIAPMPGKGTVGIEIPNEKPQTVSMHSVIASKRFQDEKKMRLPIALGRTITNEIFMFDLAKTPHLLVAGATGQGKSVAINAIITSLLYKKHPAEMKMVLVDPKMVEFAPYKPLLRHYLAAMPDTEEKDVIITDCSKVIDTLNSLVIEMENRYTLLMDAGVRNLEDYNDKFVQRRLNPEKVVGDRLHHQYLPYIVIVIDEYGDFIMQAGKQVETPIARITQKARAVGMHMILATQRPSVNIVTGVIKANIPTRIALRTQSLIDSRTVLDTKGAEQLIGRGDLLYSGSGNITRVQCAFVDTPEVDAIVEHVEHQQHYSAPYELPEYVGGEGGGGEALEPGSVDLKKLDPMFAEIARYVVLNQQGSTSVLQRRFEIGYNRAGKLTDQLEAAGIVGPNKGSKGREVLIQDEMALREVFERLGLL